MAKAVFTTHDHPEQNTCTECDFETDFDHYTVNTPDGPLCQGCANDAIPGLGDVAHGLSLIKWALVYDITHDQRPTVIRHLAEVGKLAADLASGALVTYEPGPNGEVQPLRPGGDDPHATIRRHTMRSVGGRR